MESEKPIPDDELILKRITNRPNNLIERRDIGLTATSFAIQPRSPGDRPSRSRQAVTSPAELLEVERRKGSDVSGWSIVALTVKDVRDLHLDVEPDPTDEDPGHCVVVPTPEQRFSHGIWSKLAKKTRVILTLPKKDG